VSENLSSHKSILNDVPFAQCVAAVLPPVRLSCTFQRSPNITAPLERWAQHEWRQKTFADYSTLWTEKHLNYSALERSDESEYCFYRRLFVCLCGRV